MLAMAPFGSFKACVRAFSSAFWDEVPRGKAAAQIRVQVHCCHPCIPDSILDEAAPMHEVDTFYVWPGYVYQSYVYQSSLAWHSRCALARALAQQQEWRCNRILLHTFIGRAWLQRRSDPRTGAAYIGLGKACLTPGLVMHGLCLPPHLHVSHLIG